jgi:hypothetical protein
MDRHDRVLAIVLTSEHLLGFARFDLAGELVERPAEIVGDRFARFSPLHEHVQVVEAPPQRFAQLPVFLETAAALQQLLRTRLVLPEVWSGDAFFDFGQFGGGAGRVKDGSAGRRRGAPDPRTCEADRRVEEPFWEY